MVRRRVRREDFPGIYEALDTPEHVRRHCMAVGDAAVNICAALTEAGVTGLDADAIRIAGYLHDIARSGRDHEAVGAEMLKNMVFSGYGVSDETHSLAIDIVSCHMKLDLPENLESIDSASVVSLADRITKEDAFVGYKGRMEDLVRRFADIPEVSEHVYENMESVLSLIDQIENKTGRELKDIAMGGRADIAPLLRACERPGRYIGGEIGSIRKEWAETTFRFCFAFPDLYEIGMSYTGMQIIYGLLNAREDTLCERVFTPSGDMEKLLTDNNMPLFSLENRMPVGNFDVVGFTLQYELCYTNVVRMLKQAKIPLFAAERGPGVPIVIAGGPCCANAEPVAPFFDLICAGDGEEILPAIADLYISNINIPREDFLRLCSQITGVYAPAFYKPVYKNGLFSYFDKKFDGLPDKISRSVSKDLETAFFPVKPIIPHIESVHDRVSVEIMRGCYRKCLFCQAGYACESVRKRSPEKIKELVFSSLANTGYDEVTLLSLSTGDYPGIEALVNDLMDELSAADSTLSMPSLRLDSLEKDTLKKIAEYKRSGLTFAPEAGTQRLRDAIGKKLSEDDVFRALDICLPLGFTKFKFYFMIGLPGEEYADLDGIAMLADKVLKHAKELGEDRCERYRINLSVSVSNFVPKPGTPFETEKGDSEEELIAKIHYLKDAVKTVKGVGFKYHDTRMSRIEMLLSKGDRRISDVVRIAAEYGSGFDSWREHFSYENWLNAFAEAGLPAEDLYTEKGQPFPWSLIGFGKVYD